MISVDDDDDDDDEKRLPIAIIAREIEPKVYIYICAFQIILERGIWNHAFLQ